MILKRVRNEDKPFLDPEAYRGHTVRTPSGRVYVCSESANSFLFAGWVQVIVWRNPFVYLAARNKARKDAQ